MRRKFIHIFTITLVAVCVMQSTAHAQEGEDLPEKPRTSTRENDTIPIIEDDLSEVSKSDELPAVILPTQEAQRLSSEKDNFIPAKSTNRKSVPVKVEKAKEDENTSNLRFNFLYYLFYKVKVGSSSTSSN